MLEGSFEKQLRDFSMKIENLTVFEGETLALIGENGSGKSTALKILSGILKPDSGKISLNGSILYDSSQKIHLSPEDRNIGFMFQNYALFPNMTAAENIAFGLRMKKVPKTDVEVRVEELTKRMGISGIADEPVTRMSGGQRQRTALARALALEPELLLLDEPLAALDVRTQDMMRRELATIIRSEDIPCIFVTHSIIDALAVADKVSVIEQGRLIATGSPEEVIHDPKNGFVSSFAESLNLFRGTVVTSGNGAVCVDVSGVKIRVVTTLSGTVSVGIRPEELIISRGKFESSAVNAFEGTITKIEDSGLSVYVYVDVGIELAAAVTRQSVERLKLCKGMEVAVTFKATAVQVFV